MITLTVCKNYHYSYEYLMHPECPISMCRIMKMFLIVQQEKKAVIELASAGVNGLIKSIVSLFGGTIKDDPASDVEIMCEKSTTETMTKEEVKEQAIEALSVLKQMKG